MKMTKKKLFVISLAICAIAIISMGTIAWFNATTEITNHFKFADTDGNGTPDFSIEASETKNDDSGDSTTDGNTYEDIAPGSVFDKNPTFENTGDYDQWVRASVTFDEYAKIQAAYTAHNKGEADLREWINVSDEWTYEETVTNSTEGTITYVYYLNRVLATDDDAETADVAENKATLFTTVTIPTFFVQEDMAFADKDFSITVKAEALQSENTDVTTAKEAFDEYWEY